VTCGIPHAGRGEASVFIREYAELGPEVSGIRRTGAASLDLAWTASGRVDAFFERGLSPWDMAAGILIAREAGATVTDLAGGTRMFASGDIAAGNEYVHGALLARLKAAAKRS